MWVHGASQGNSETERVAPTQIPSPKPSELIAFLVAGAKHLTESNFWKKGFILAFFGEYGQSTSAGKAGQQEQKAAAPGTAAVGKREEDCWCSAACFLLLFQPGSQPLRGAVYLWRGSLLQLILPENTLAGVPGGAMSEWF